MPSRTIFHVDMDAFFASVEEREHPEYRGQPLIIGGLSGRGVVSTCSYAARKYGVHSAMAMAEAERRCPDGIFIEGDYPLYKRASGEVFAIFHEFAPVVEPLSIDEAFLDVTGMDHLFGGPARRYAERLKEAIRTRTRLVASVGIAPNKFLAKIASDLEKPDGLVEVGRTPDEIRAFLHPLPVSRLWGVGKKTAAKLASRRVRTIGDLAKLPYEVLRKDFGEKTAAHLAALANGIDEREVAPPGEAKSIGNEETFPEDIRGADAVRKELLHLAEKVGWRLRRAGRKARTIQIKVRRGDFTTWTRAKTLPVATCYDEEIYDTACRLFEGLRYTGGVRLLGISTSNFDDGVELSLFHDDAKKEDLYHAIDGLKKKFGETIIRHGRSAGET